MSVKKKKCVYLVFSEPTEGMEEEYNRWYNNTHLKQVVSVPGIIAAQRYKLSEGDQGPHEAPETYLAIYEIETDGDPLKVTAQLADLFQEGKLIMSEAIDFNKTKTWVYGAIGERLCKGA